MEATQDDIYLETSQTYVGRWIKLVSTTNWEKGEIILRWRDDLIARGAPVAEYSDEAWSRRVGNVSPQHVGRLRRVFERFDKYREEFGGLFWSHFQAALDWEDAEMWLEGAVQNGWSVAAMKRQRWEALGAPADQTPSDDEAAGELDEDVDPSLDGAPAAAVEASVGVVQDLDGEAGEQGASTPWEGDADENDAPEDAEAAGDEYDAPSAETMTAVPKARPFEGLPSLPEDLSDAVEAFKLSIIRHKMLGWDEISQADVIKTLEALKTLALTPPDEE
jgi:hypothetical protein